MVIGRERTNWYSEHGAACTCFECVETAASRRRFEEVTHGRKVGRNEKCPCGSEKKYKKCHGA